MLTSEQFRKYAHEFVDWMADYLENVADFPVKPNIQPREIYSQIPEHPPSDGEPMENIMQDFQRIIMPGMTHWQSPTFFAYFPGNSSYPSLLAEMLTATLGAQCMIWDTSPAAAELEERMMQWLLELLGLPANWDGVIQDTASTATLTAIIAARERAAQFKTNSIGLSGAPQYRVYCSADAHSSVDKAVAIVGLGRENLVKVAVDERLRLDPAALRESVQADLLKGLHPLCVVATLGTTGTTAVDPLREIAEVCDEFNLWLHVDAAFAGTALALPEFRWMIDGIERVDSFVMNPHKWMFTNFDCSAYFVRDKETLLRTFEILPEYLKTQSRGQVNDYRDWGIQLGRRFRALKLWFVLRSFGVSGIREKLRYHISLAEWLEQQIAAHPEFELMAERVLNLVCFRYKPPNLADDEVDILNSKLLNSLNASGGLYLTHTRIDGKYTLRMVIGQTTVGKSHVETAWKEICRLAPAIISEA